MKININEAEIDEAIIGGAILGGGGGGWIEEGKKLAEVAIKRGFREIWPLELIDPASLLLTVSAVGAPSSGPNQLLPEDYARAVELFLENSRAKIAGLISSEIGAMAIVNGWVQSALLGIPVIDAPANGRAHPLGLMGSMGLHKIKNYISQQAAVGRDKKGKRIERFFVGSIEETAKAVREMAAELGGLVAVARNPVEAHYVKLNGAPQAIRKAIALGKIYIEKKKAGFGSQKIIESILSFFGDGSFINGRIKKYSLSQKNGFDLGQIQIESPSGNYELSFWNEYMTLEKNSERLATFPDLIITFDLKRAKPLISAAIKKDQEIIILIVPAQKLLLGSGTKDPLLWKRIEQITGKKIIGFVNI